MTSASPCSFFSCRIILLKCVEWKDINQNYGFQQIMIFFIPIIDTKDTNNYHHQKKNIQLHYCTSISPIFNSKYHSMNNGSWSTVSSKCLLDWTDMHYFTHLIGPILIMWVDQCKSKITKVKLSESFNLSFHQNPIDWNSTHAWTTSVAPALCEII